jgi:hypothetical protein
VKNKPGLTARERRKLFAACQKLQRGPDYRMQDYVPILMNTALDFMMRAATERAACTYFMATHGSRIATHADLASALASFDDMEAGNREAARYLWNNNHWTRIGFLRALLAYFDELGIHDLESLRDWARTADYERDIKGRVRSPHHSMGPAILRWLQLRLGLPTVKPDRWVLRFVESAIGRRPNPTEAVEALVSIALQLGWEPFALDSAIYNSMSQTR